MTATWAKAASGRTALAIAHPGHELRLLEWMREARPAVYVMTAGSRHGESRDRIAASRRLAAQMGATPGEVFGDLLDRDVYEHILASDARPFLDLAAALGDGFARRSIELVVVDAWQFYNVSHDLWHLTVRAAAVMAGAALGRPIRCVEFEVVPPAMCGRRIGPALTQRVLSDSQVEAKLAVAAGFPDVAEEVRQLLAAGGREFIGTESLHDLRSADELRPRAGETPHYEREGEAKVAAGIYASVLRWRHVAPIAEALIQLMGARAAA